MSECGNGQAHIKGMVSFRASIKRGYDGVHRQVSAKRMGRYVIEFSGRYDGKKLDTISQITNIAQGFKGKRPPNRTLTAARNLP